MKPKTYHYTVIFERTEDGGYQAMVPALSALTVYGKNLNETRGKVINAIKQYIEKCIKDKETILRESKSIRIEKITVSVRHF